VGLLDNPTPDDEAILQAIGAASSMLPLSIVDARPFLSAQANKATGKGYELIGRLGGETVATIKFLGMENIHVVRESYRGLLTAILRDNKAYHQAVHDSRWLHHIHDALNGGVAVARDLTEGKSVLVHCSDGWDRTPILCVICQILIDPYYRSMEGLRALLEKEFLSFGHLYTHRCGIQGTNEAAPIMLQLLDVLWQLYTQFPTAFEFNEYLLELIATAVATGIFEDFKFNSVKEREEKIKPHQRLFLWEHVSDNAGDFVNCIYDTHASPPMLQPSCELSALRVWRQVHGRRINFLDCDHHTGGEDKRVTALEAKVRELQAKLEEK